MNYLEETVFNKEFDTEFFKSYLKQIDFKDIKIYSMPEGSIVFPREPIMVLEGKHSTLHLLEPYLLSNINTARFGFFFHKIKLFDFKRVILAF